MRVKIKTTDELPREFSCLDALPEDGMYRDSAYDLVIITKRREGSSCLFVAEDAVLPVDEGFISWPVTAVPAGTSITLTQE